MNNYWDAPECREPHLDAPAFMPAGSTVQLVEDHFEAVSSSFVEVIHAVSSLCERADAFWWKGWNV